MRFKGGTYTTRIQHPVRPPKEGEIFGYRMNHHIITMCPHTIVFLEISAEISLSTVIVPEINGHIGECVRGNKLAGCAVLDCSSFDASSAFDKGVEDGYWSPEGRTLSTANVDWGEGIFLAETACLFTF